MLQVRWEGCDSRRQLSLISAHTNAQGTRCRPALYHPCGGPSLTPSAPSVESGLCITFPDTSRLIFHNFHGTIFRACLNSMGCLGDVRQEYINMTQLGRARPRSVAAVQREGEGRKVPLHANISNALIALPSFLSDG